VNNLIVNSQFLSVIRDDQDANGSRTMTESLLQLAPEMALVNNLETLLDLTGLGHGNELAIITNVDKTILLKDRAEQGVENHWRRGMRNNARFFMKLLGEKVNTKVSVLAGLGAGGNTNDLARTVLENHEIANADVMTRDGEGALGLGVSWWDVRRGWSVKVMMRLVLSDTTGKMDFIVAGGSVSVVLDHFERV
jgi:hypothetical protein